ncbi:MAG: ribonuclease Z, partial [Akkermansiaceae bacterium]|nr:ribonuclease Z [Armatimonadota bacterium]
AEMVELASDADLLIHEATFAESERSLADRASHSTASDAARVAEAARVRRLILTHISPRYDAESGAGLEMLLGEARALFPDTEVAHDFMRVEVPRRDHSDHPHADE